MTQGVVLSVQDGILEVRLDRPDKYNAITREMLDAMTRAVRDFGARPDLRVMLIRATGKFFSAGADFAAIDFSDVGESTARYRQQYRAGSYTYHPLGDEMEAVEKPIVVAHQGPCLGGALEFSLSCDFRIAARSAAYAFPEIGFGMLPGSGGVSRLVRLVGPHWARWMIIAGERIVAEQALALGLVHRVHEDDVFEDEVRAFCRRLAAQPPEAVAMAKLAIELAQDLGRAEARNVERLSNSALFMGPEHKALMAAVAARFAKSK